MGKTVASIGFVYVIATLGWFLLRTTIVSRTEDQQSTLKKEVGQLWGDPLTQPAPSSFLQVERIVQTEVYDQARQKKHMEKNTVIDRFGIPITKTDIRVDFHLDQRQKGLLWYST